uniref:DUF86 domain-containing protein n=1 Tax=Dictyoglomus turgidum TaxID=513050 RepID=A0A7C3WWR8_9BACT
MIKERIKKLNETLEILEYMKNNFDMDELKLDKIKQYALKYGIYLCITGIGEIACAYLNEIGIENISNFKECIAMLGEMKILDRFLVERLMELMKYRDLLKRPYIEIDILKLYSLLERLDLFKEFIDKITIVIRV